MTLQNQRYALVSSVTGFKNSGSQEIRGNTPLFIKPGAASAMLLIVPRINMKDCNGFRQHERYVPSLLFSSRKVKTKRSFCRVTESA